jgi:hypothetical protein
MELEVAFEMEEFTTEEELTELMEVNVVEEVIELLVK